VKIAVFAGPTGGHFYPALAFSEAFLRRHPDAEILFVTGERGRRLAEKAPGRFNYEFIQDFPFPRPRSLEFFSRIFPFLIKLVRVFTAMEKRLTAFGPQLSIGFGSYVSFPGLVVSRRRKVPTVIHEQNRKMGKANRYLVRWADRIALSFPVATPDPRVEMTGLPLRSTLLEKARQKTESSFPIPPKKVRLLIVCGSQGSEAVNRLWLRALGLLSHEEKLRMAVIHITGEEDLERFQKMYPALGLEAEVFSYYERMEELYFRSDFALTRAGAGTLFELALFGMPAVVFPYPHAESHQEANARYFHDEKALILLDEAKCTPDELKENLLILINSSELRRKLSGRMRGLAQPEAAEKLVEAAEALL